MAPHVLSDYRSDRTGKQWAIGRLWPSGPLSVDHPPLRPPEMAGELVRNVDTWLYPYDRIAANPPTGSWPNRSLDPAVVNSNDTRA